MKLYVIEHQIDGEKKNTHGFCGQKFLRHVRVPVSQSEWDGCISSRRTQHRNGATDTGYVRGSIIVAVLSLRILSRGRTEIYCSRLLRR